MGVARSELTLDLLLRAVGACGCVFHCGMCKAASGHFATSKLLYPWAWPVSYFSMGEARREIASFLHGCDRRVWATGLDMTCRITMM